MMRGKSGLSGAKPKGIFDSDLRMKNTGILRPFLLSANCIIPSASRRRCFFFVYILSFIRHGLLLLIPLSLVATVYLYFSPVFHLCTFPSPGISSAVSFLSTFEGHIGDAAASNAQMAPFRLLALGDPQLEGDTSLPDSDAAYFPSLGIFHRSLNVSASSNSSIDWTELLKVVT